MSGKEKLNKLRAEIDKADAKIVEVINKRTGFVLEIGKLKEKNKAEVYAPDREHKVYQKVFGLNKGPMKNKSLEAIYREIMSASLALEKEITIGFLGPRGSFTHQACIQKFGSSLPFKPLKTIQDVFKSVEDTECDYGVVPIENSTEGGVSNTLDLFIDSTVHICSEISIPIQHNLMSVAGKLDKIKRVYSHPQIFGQCRQWILGNIPSAELIEASSSSKAVQMASEDKDSAAMASKLCAQIYDLKIIAKSIQDKTTNVTRFAILANGYPPKTGNDKTSLVVFLKDKVGALHDTLLYFKGCDLNLTRIESRPSKKRPWEYYFFIDFVGHCDNLKIQDMLKNLDDHCEVVKVIGSYPIYKEPIEGIL